MANLKNPAQTSQDSASLVRNVSELLKVISWKKVPFLSLIGGGNDDQPALSTLSESFTNAQKYEWQDDPLRPMGISLAAIGTTGVTALTTTVPADGLHMVKGLVIQVDSEQLLVTVAGDDTGAFTVSRAYGGTSAATHAAAATARVVTRVSLEDETWPNDPIVVPDQQYNVGQQFIETYGFSDAERGTKRYWAMSEQEKWDIAKMKAATQVFRQMQATIFWSRTRVPFSPTNPGLMGGARVFMDPTMITNKSAAALTAADIDGILAAQHDQGGAENMSDLIVTNYAGGQKLTTLFGSSMVTVYQEASETSGGIRLDKVRTQAAELEILLLNGLPPATMWMFKRDYLGVGWLENNELGEVDLPNNTTSMRKALKGIATLEVRGKYSHGLIENYT